MAAALYGNDARLFLVPEADRARRCAGALRPLHLAPVRRQRRNWIAHLALARRLFSISVFLSGHCQAFCRAAKFAHQWIVAAQRSRLSGRRYRSVAQFRHVQRFCGGDGLRHLHQLERRGRALSPRAIAVAHYAADDSLALPHLVAGLARRARRRSLRLRID